MNKGCTITNREDTVIAYLYDDLAPGERLAFETHITECFVCQTELNELGAVRGQLQQWSPPEPARALSGAVAAPVPVATPSRWAAVKDIPYWAQAAAAVLVLGVAAGAANLQVKVGTDGVTVNTGWLKPVSTSVATDGAVSQEDLRALAVSLRQEMDAKVNATSTSVEVSATRRADEMLNKTRAMLAASEKKQDVELALRVGNAWTDMLALRERDNRIIENALQRQDSRAANIAYETVNTLAQRVNLTK